MSANNLQFSRQLTATLVVLATCFLVACAARNPSLGSKLDPHTSVTITFSHSQMVFYREVPGRAAYARDYVHIAPLEVNHSGTYRYFLWLGHWTTMQDGESDRSVDGFESIVIFADGEPLPLEAAGWTPSAIGAGEPVYLKPVANAMDGYYEVSVDQLRLIAEATNVRLQSTGPQGNSFIPWDDQRAAKAGLLKFLDESVF